MKLAIVFLLMMRVLFACNTETKVEQSNSSGFLDSLSHNTFTFFWELADSTTGNQPDRWPTPSFSSIGLKKAGFKGGWLEKL
jgi:hypothetical protein